MNIIYVGHMRYLQLGLLLVLVRSKTEKSGDDGDDDLNRPIYSMPTMGRPVQVGMLYDAATDHVIMSSALLNATEQTKYSQRESIGQVSKSIGLSDQYEYNRVKLGLGISLTGSILSGLIEIKGSANYFQDKRSKNSQIKISQQVKFKTFSIKLHHDAIKEITFKPAYKKISSYATHIVTKIVYGASGNFVYDFFEEQYNVTFGFGLGIQGSLNLFIARVTGGVNIEFEFERFQRKSKMQVRYFGDYELPFNPVTLNDSMTIIENSYLFLGPEHEKSVPLYMDLTPLSDVYQRDRDVLEKVKVDKLKLAEELFEDLQDSMRLNQDCIAVSKKFDIFPIRKLAARTAEYLSAYNFGKKSKLSVLLPKIRRKQLSQTALDDFILEFKTSPYCYRVVGEKFLYEAGKHAEIIQTAIQQMPSANTVRMPAMLLDSLLINQHVFVYLFRESTYNQPFMQQLKDNLDGNNGTNNSYDTYKRAYFNLSRTELALRLEEFSKLNPRNGYLILNVDYNTLQASKTHPVIHYYDSGRLLDKDYDMPSAPGTPQLISSTHNSLHIGWSPPAFGAKNVYEYGVKYMAMSGAMEEVEIFTRANDTIISDLDAGVPYTIKVYPWARPGVAPHSENDRYIWTRPSSPPGRPTASFINDSTIAVTWHKPTMIAPMASVVGYLVRYHRKNQSHHQTTTHTNTESLSISYLTKNTTYIFYVAAILEVNTTIKNSNPTNKSMSSTASIPLTTGPSCEPGWYKLRVHCYFISLRHTLPWKTYEQARNDCESRDGTLTDVLDVEEAYEVSEWCGKQNCWVGLVDHGDGKGWQWESGATFVAHVISWKQKNLDNFNATNHKSYCGYVNENGKLDHTECGGIHNPSKHYICKKHITKKSWCPFS